MEVRGPRGIVWILLLAVVVLCSVQCTARKQVVKEDDGTVLRQRVQEYWNYRMKGEWDKTYVYEVPEYRERVDLASYKNQNGRSPMRIESFDITELWTSGDEGNVTLKIKHRWSVPNFQRASFEQESRERWVKKDRQWYHLSGA